MFGPDPIGSAKIAMLLEETWGFRPQSVEYSPIGYGSYHWHADGPDGRWLVTADKDDQRPVVAAYQLASLLGEELEFVRSPQPRLGGGVVSDEGEWLISVWPWVVGSSGEFAEPRSPDELAVVADCLRRLHECADVPQVAELVEDWEISGRHLLMEALTSQRNGGPAGPYAAEVAERIVANRSRVLDLLARYDELVAGIRDTAELVITHGEPHTGNVVHTDSGAVLIDWDTVRWAPRERDLWWLPTAGWQQSYGEDVAVSEAAIDLYRLRWTLCDLGDFAPALLVAPAATADLDAAMVEVKRILPQ